MFVCFKNRWIFCVKTTSTMSNLNSMLPKNISKTFQPVSTTMGNVPAYPGKGLTGASKLETTLSTTK